MAREHEGFDQIPEGEFQAELTDTQKAALKFSIELGKRIQADFPQIAADFRAGMSVARLLREYNIMEAYGVGSARNAEGALYYALRGYDGYFNFLSATSYAGLIAEPAEFKRLSNEHRQQVGFRQVAEKAGIHAQTRREQIELGRQAAVEQGKIPFSDDEIALVKKLAADPAYQRRSRLNAQKIAEEVNRVVHQGKEIRNARSIVKVYFTNKNR